MKTKTFKWQVLLVTILLITQMTELIAQPTPPSGLKWETVPELTDEFNSFDASKWQKGHPYWDGRDPSEYNNDNVIFQNGELQLKMTLKDANMQDNWIWASCLTSQTKAFTVGMYAESRVKIANLPSSTAFWMQGNYSEIDVIENFGDVTVDKWEYLNYSMFTHTHYFINGWDNDQVTNHTTTNPNNELNNNGYHTFAVWWKDNRNLVFYRDGVEVSTGYTAGAFNEPMYMFFDTEAMPWIDQVPTIAQLNDDSRNTAYFSYVHTYKLVDDDVNNTNSVAFVNPPASIETGEDLTVQISYEASQQYELVAIVNAPDNTWLANDRQTVAAGTGTATLTISQGAGWSVDNNYKLGVAIRPVGGNFDSNLDYTSTTFNVVNGDIGVSGVSVSPTSLTLDVGETSDLTETISPSNATNKAVNWSSNNSLVASVNANGLVTANATGSASITVTTVDGSYTASCAVTVNPIISNQTPYGGSARSIPGTIEAEHYDIGGQDIAYYDNTSGNSGGAVRTDDVDIEARDGGYNVGWTANGEWLEYTVNATAGTYTMEARLAAISTGKKINVELDGVSLGSFDVPNTGDWGTFQTINISNVNVSGGNSKILKLIFDGGSVNLNWVKFTATSTVIPVTGVSLSQNSMSITAGLSSDLDETVAPANATDKSVSWSSSNTAVATVNSNGLVSAIAAGSATITVETNDGGYTASCNVTVNPVISNQTPYGGSAQTIPGTIEAEYYDVGGQDIAYYDNTSGNSGGAVRTDDVDIEARDGGYNVGWTANGEWLEYTVNATAGTYTMEARLAAISTGKKINVELDGISLGSFDVPNTGDWGTFQTINISNVNVSGGNSKILKLTFDGGSVNLNWVKFTATSTVIPVTGVSLSQNSMSITAGLSSDLDETVAPANATDKSVSWSSNNTAIATVNSSGLVSAVAAGSATITVETIDGGYTASCNVTVGSDIEPTTVTLSPIHDAYLQGSTRFNNTILRIESGYRLGYLMYDLSSINGTITNAQLKMTCNGDAGNGTININLGSSNNWTESNLSSSNAPSTGALLGSLNTTYSIGSTYTWNLAASSLTGGGNVSLVVNSTGGNDAAFASKENSATEPQLVITYDKPKSAESPLSDNSDIELEVYPVPASNELNILVNHATGKRALLNICNLQGAVIFTQEISTGFFNQLDISLLNSGMYILHVQIGEESRMQKLLII